VELVLQQGGGHMLDVDQQAAHAEQGVTITNMGSDTDWVPASHAEVAPILPKEVASAQLFAGPIGRAKELIGQLVVSSRCYRRLSAGLLVEGVQLYHQSEAHPAAFQALLDSLQIKVNAGTYIMQRRIIAVLFASLTKGEGSFADRHVNRSQRTRYTRALARALAMESETPLDNLADKIMSLGGYTGLDKIEREVSRDQTRKDCALRMVDDTPVGRPELVKPTARVKLKAPISQPVLMIVYPNGDAYTLKAEANVVKRFAEEIGRAA
jgi:hypothetical protein